MAYLSRSQIRELGFASVGRNAKISDKASIHGAARISIGDESRIDDFCVLSAGEGGILIGKHVHVAVYTALIGAARIMLEDFSNLSARVSIYSSSDDFSGEFMTNPTVPPAFTGVKSAPVTVERHAIVGCGSVILPGVIVGEGVAVGALSLVNKSCAEFGIYAGVPARRIGERKRQLVDLETKFLAFKNSEAMK